MQRLPGIVYLESIARWVVERAFLSRCLPGERTVCGVRGTDELPRKFTVDTSEGDYGLLQAIDEESNPRWC